MLEGVLAVSAPIGFPRSRVGCGLDVWETCGLKTSLIRNGLVLYHHHIPTATARHEHGTLQLVSELCRPDPPSSTLLSKSGRFTATCIGLWPFLSPKRTMRGRGSCMLLAWWRTPLNLSTLPGSHDAQEFCFGGAAQGLSLGEFIRKRETENINFRRE